MLGSWCGGRSSGH